MHSSSRKRAPESNIARIIAHDAVREIVSMAGDGRRFQRSSRRPGTGVQAAAVAPGDPTALPDLARGRALLRDPCREPVVR